jgi:hypothetical protein
MGRLVNGLCIGRRREYYMPRKEEYMKIAALLMGTVIITGTGGTAMAKEAGVTDKTPGWYVFTMKAGDGALGAADVSFLNEGPAGKDGFISIKDGHFTDGKGNRVRFFATNLTATACFPKKEDAGRLAKRLRALGFNLVRLHFMDIEKPYGLFNSDLLTIDAEQLDRLDNLIASLKAEGIYVDINLHVARRYPGLEGDAAKRFEMGKVVDRFYPPFVELQKRYARELLSHVNPYTGNAYSAEPGVAMVELNNENTMLPFWGPGLQNMPEPFAGSLASQWRAWLKKKYGGTEALRKAWNEGARQAGAEMVANVSVSEGKAGWRNETGNGSESSLAFVAGSGTGLPAGLKAMHWEARKPGTADWNLQVVQGGIAITPGESYELSFWARSEAPVELDVSLFLDGTPWTGLGLSTKAKLGGEWKRYSWVFAGVDSGGPKGRVNISTGNKTGVIDIAGVSLKTAARAGLPEGETLEKDNVAMTFGGGTPPAVLDWWSFLVDTERGTTGALVRLLKDELKVRAPIADTQASYGQVAGVLREALLCDYTDMHGYWQHPSNWGPDWTMDNTSQVASKDYSTLADIALHRVKDRPFTVSEYNIPTPNDHAAETLPMLAAIGAFQDWDAVFPYTYMDFKQEWDAEKFVGFFDFAGHPGKLVFAPAAALAFRLGLVGPGKDEAVLTIPSDGAGRLLASGKSSVTDMWKTVGVPQGAVSVRRVAVAVGTAGAEVKGSGPVEVKDVRTSDTGEMAWEPGAKQPSFIVNAPAFRMAAGMLSGRKVALGDATVEFVKLEKDYACVSLVALDGKPLAESKKVLVSLAGRVENQGMGWNEKRTSVGREWGRGPTVAERIGAKLTLQGKWKAERLDGKGKPAGKLYATTAKGKTTVKLGDGNKASLWYLISR